MTTLPARPSASDCPDYEAQPSARRCRHYVGYGRCSTPQHAECIDWRRANPTLPLPAMPTFPAAAQLSFGIDGRPEMPAVRSERRRLPIASAINRELSPAADLPPGLRPEAVASLAARGVEVCLPSPTLGDIWLVPAYTEADRREMTFKHAAALATIVHAFPGAQPTDWWPLQPGAER
jgi:hypothetical protein